MLFCNNLSETAQIQQYCMMVQNSFQIYWSVDASALMASKFISQHLFSDYMRSPFFFLSYNPKNTEC